MCGIVVCMYWEHMEVLHALRSLNLHNRLNRSVVLSAVSVVKVQDNDCSTIEFDWSLVHTPTSHVELCNSENGYRN